MAPPAELTLATLIVFKGSGSWKREARRDEYVVKLTNLGTQPLGIDQVELIDTLGHPQIPGSEPWKLEKLSSTNWDKYGKTGLSLVAGAGAASIYGTAALYVGLGGGLAAIDTMLVAFPVLMVADVTAIALINQNNKGNVQAEFARRRLT